MRANEDKGPDLSLALIENLPFIAMILKKETREIVVSNKMAREIGAIPGQKCYEKFAMRSEPCPFCLAPEAWATGSTRLRDVEYNGKWYEARWSPLDEDLYVHYVSDITERKKMEMELRESEEKFRSLYENAPLPYQSLTETGNILYVNNTWLETLGYA